MPRNNILTDGEKDAALEVLRRSRARVAKLSAPSESGVYAIYLRTPGLLVPFPEREDGLICIGQAANLARRVFEQHFSAGRTGSSALRRSLGALLKSRLSLVAIPRAPGQSEANVRNFCFESDGEDRLTGWMRAHLEVGAHVSGNHRALEDRLIAELKPLLNLTNWPNPHAKEIRLRRKACADEARKARHVGKAYSPSSKVAGLDDPRC